MADNKWIQKATTSISRRGTKGKCTPITKSGCTGRARALALTFKKMAKNRKKEDGGIIESENGYAVKLYKNGGIYIRPPKRGETYAEGGVNPYTAGTDMLGNFTTNVAGNSTGASLAGGMLSGIGAGATLGPLGMAGGALLGGVSSLLGSSAKKQQQMQLERVQKEQNDAVRNRQYLASLPQQQSYQPTFPCGGMVRYPEGGKIAKKPIAVSDTSRIPVDTTIVDTMKPTRQRLASFKNINDPNLYKSIEDPSRDISPYFSAMLESSSGKSNPYTETYLDNVNRKFGKNMGYYYDPSKGSLRTVLPGTPRYSELENIYRQYDLQGPTEGKPLGGGMLGVKAYGGYIYADGGNIQGNAELEQGEPYRTPDGQIHQISNNAPTHAQGGVQMNLPNGTEILGKMNDPESNKEFKEIGRQLKKAQDKHAKILENKPTLLAKKTSQMMLDKIRNKYDELMSRQEAIKSQNDYYSFANGGIYKKYQDGSELTGQGAYSWDIQNPLYTAGVQPTYMMNNNTQAASETSTVPFNPQQDTFTDLSSGNDNSGRSLGSTLENIGTFAPIAYNLGQGVFGKSKNINPSDYYNPYEGEVKNLMAGRRYDVEPELQANRESMSNYLQALREGAPSQARYTAGIQQAQIAKQRADSETYSRKQNMENEYRAQQAQSLANLGSQQAIAKLNVENMNAESQAAQNRYLSTALSQLQQAAFVGKQTRMQKLRDQQRLAIAKELYKNYPFDITNLINQ